MPSAQVVIVGQGYVGLPIAMRAVDAGFDVIGLDTSAPRISMLNAGDSYVDDVPSEVLRAAQGSGRYRVSRNYAEIVDFDFAVITVPTPLANGLPDLTFIESATRDLAPSLTPGATVVLESTTYPGTTEEVVVPLLEAGSGLVAGEDFFVGYSPERIDPGNAQWHFRNTPKVVSGINEASLRQVKDFYDTLVETTVVVSGTREAELTKLLENTFRHVNIALINELAVFARQMGVDVWESIDAASTKPFGFMRFVPGPGVGGHCLPVDPTYLSWKAERVTGASFRFIELANDINDYMPQYVVERATELLPDGLVGATVLVVGVAYKRGTGDVRESPAIRVIGGLRQAGARVLAEDSHVPDYGWPADAVRVRPGDDAHFHEIDLAIIVTRQADSSIDAILEWGGPTLDASGSVHGPNVHAL